MNLVTHLLFFSPILLFLVSFGLYSLMAKRIAFWTSIPWMGTLLPALWLAHGCGGSNLREAACATTPEMLSSPIAHIALLTIMAWILIGPIVMIVVGAIEWRAQR